MKKYAISLIALVFSLSCSPRDFLTRRLASDLISASQVFRTPQTLVLETGVVSSKEYPSPEFLVLQQHGWISVTNGACPVGLTPPPCWDVVLTPSGVDAVRTLISADDANKPSFSISVARRELVGVVGVSKQGNTADVDFTWRWIPLNEIGAALYSSDLSYQSTVSFRDYDDGWHLVERTPHHEQTLEEALKNAEPSR